VVGLMHTSAGTSATVSAGTVATSLIVLTLLYGVLAVVEVGLLVKYAVAGPPPPGIAADEEPPADDESRPLTFAY